MELQRKKGDATLNRWEFDSQEVKERRKWPVPVPLILKYTCNRLSSTFHAHTHKVTAYTVMPSVILEYDQQQQSDAAVVWLLEACVCFIFPDLFILRIVVVTPTNRHLV